MKYFLVSGCCGFIGSNLAEQLLKDGHAVLGIDDMSTGTEDNLNVLWKYGTNFTFMRHNLVKPFLHLDLPVRPYECVFHTSALARIQPSIQNPTDCLDRNLKALMNVLEWMKKFNVKNIVFSSSSSIYGLKNADNLPLKEDYEPDCLNQYSWSKYAGEKLIETYCKLYNMKAVNLRYFNVYGPREVLNAGQYSPVVGLFFKQALQDKVPLTIVGDGLQTRDMTYVTDVVSANIKASEFLKEDTIFPDIRTWTFNVGTGTEMSILEMVNSIRKILNEKGIEITFKFVDARPGEARYTRADISRFKGRWHPSVSIAEGLKLQAEYYLDKYGYNK